MGKKLAIEHHLIRPNEVIELLEMMGGKNTDNADGCSFLYYTLCTPKINNPNNDKVICGFTNLKMQNDYFAIFTLEKFWKKYPYKVGDKVVYEDGLLGVVTKMEWDCEKSDMKYYISFKIPVDNKWYSSKNIKCKFMEAKSKKLAIKGHPTRGNEVIEIFEMMGGNNPYEYSGENNMYGYYLSNYTILSDRFSIAEDDDFEIFTLEEFLEEYPFKVGDKVHIYVQNDDIDGRYDIEVAEITSMRWNPTIRKIAYKMKDINREFYKEEIKCKVDDSNKQTSVMGKKLAIQGHRRRNNEVIGLLEMIGGHNVHKTIGNNDETFYYIDDKNNIDCDSRLLNNNRFTVFTLEEFLAKYPFNVGNKVADGYGNTLTIKSMSWSEDYATMVYDFESSSAVLTAEDIEAINNTGLKIENTNMNIEFDLAKYSYEIKDGKLVVSEKTPKYPNNYEDCVRIAKNIHGYDIYIDAPAYRELLESFVKLLICRDAYWKIAGEEMGLGKSWEPDWSKSEPKYVLVCTCNGIEKQWERTYCKTFAFPTEEIRDTFFEDFKDLIEECKELL